MKTSMNLKQFMVCFIVSATLFSCVPAKKYEELQERRLHCEETNIEIKTENEKFFTENTEMKRQIELQEKKIVVLSQDTLKQGEKYRSIRRNYDQLHKTYQILLDKNEQLLEGDRSETQLILERLQETQKDLQKREDELLKAARQLEAKENNLNSLNNRLQASIKELEQKEVRLMELESVLKKQDSMVNVLRRRVSAALLGFEDEGLTVDIRHGKVYVSLEESLLFESGRYKVDPRGINALQELAKVLERNPDINVLVEGHTDDVPLIPSGDMQDNWDLSVLRATAIVKVLLKNSNLDPQRLTAAGRGEFMPIDLAQTPEARRKNRRTEIILTPKLDELFQIIDSN